MPIPSYYNKPLDEMSYNERIGKQSWDAGQTPYTNQAGIKTNIGYADESTYGGNTGWLRDYFGNQARQVPIGLSAGNIEDLRREQFGIAPIQEQAPQQTTQQSSPNPFQYMGRNPFQSGTSQYDDYMNAQSSAWGAPQMQTEAFQNPMSQPRPQMSPTETRQIGYGAGAYNVPFSQFMQNPQYYNQQSAAMSPQFNPFMQYQRKPHQPFNPSWGGGSKYPPSGYNQPQQPSNPWGTRPTQPGAIQRPPWMDGGGKRPTQPYVPYIPQAQYMGYR